MKLFGNSYKMESKVNCLELKLYESVVITIPFSYVVIHIISDGEILKLIPSGLLRKSGLSFMSGTLRRELKDFCTSQSE